MVLYAQRTIVKMSWKATPPTICSASATEDEGLTNFRNTIDHSSHISAKLINAMNKFNFLLGLTFRHILPAFLVAKTKGTLNCINSITSFNERTLSGRRLGTFSSTETMTHQWATPFRFYAFYYLPVFHRQKMGGNVIPIPLKHRGVQTFWYRTGIRQFLHTIVSSTNL